jgi:hypothetical protein
MRTQVFISYSSRDEPHLHDCVRELHDRLPFGVHACWDKLWGFRARTDVDALIEGWVDECQVMVILLSSSWLRSKWCPFELKYARERDIPIIAVLLEPLSWIEESLPPELVLAGTRTLAVRYISLNEAAAGSTRKKKWDELAESIRADVRDVGFDEGAEGLGKLAGDVVSAIRVYGRIAIVIDDDVAAPVHLAREIYGISSVPGWWLHVRKLEYGPKALAALEAVREAHGIPALVVVDRVLPLWDGQELRLVDWDEDEKVELDAKDLKAYARRWTRGQVENLWMLQVTRSLPRRQSEWMRKSESPLYTELRRSKRRVPEFFRFGPASDEWSAAVAKWYNLLGLEPEKCVLVRGMPGKTALLDRRMPTADPKRLTMPYEGLTEETREEIVAEAEQQAAASAMTSPFAALAVQLGFAGCVALGWDSTFERALVMGGRSPDRVFRVYPRLDEIDEFMRSDGQVFRHRVKVWNAACGLGQGVSLVCLDTALTDPALRIVLETFLVENFIWVSRTANAEVLGNLIPKNVRRDIIEEDGVAFLYDMLALRR